MYTFTSTLLDFLSFHCPCNEGLIEAIDLCKPHFMPKDSNVCKIIFKLFDDLFWAFYSQHQKTFYLKTEASFFRFKDDAGTVRTRVQINRVELIHRRWGLSLWACNICTASLCLQLFIKIRLTIMSSLLFHFENAEYLLIVGDYILTQ